MTPSKKLDHSRARLANLRRALHLAWSAAPNWTLAWAILLSVQGLLPAAIVYLSGLLVNSIVAAIDTGAAWETVRPTLILAGILAVTSLLSELLRAANQWVRLAQAEHIQDHIKGIIHEQSAAVE